MAIRTPLTELLNLSVPVIQAPMAGGGDTADLVSAVSNAGAFGSIGAAYLTPEGILERSRAIRAKTSRPFGINLFAPLPSPGADAASMTRAVEAITPYFAELGLPAPEPPTPPAAAFDDQLAASLETGASVFSFTFGTVPQRAVEEVKRRKIVLIGTATTVAEAQALVELGVDGVVAQGSEAGGHRGTFATDFDSGMIGLMSLVPQIVDAVPVPVIASGGIMDGRGIAAALVLGAAGVQLGTAFLTCTEAGVAPAYQQAILDATEHQTKTTRAFSGRPARGIVNRVLRAYEHTAEAILPFPLQNALTRPMRSEAARQGRADYLSLWAGQGLRMARRMSAAALIACLKAEMEATLESLEARR
ncbi:MAG TPA: nitronate monooxygenase [Bryobacteraceae bacterium]